eukprot:jgi/Tetstr1/446133/TSEL_033732.t2
MAPAKKQQPAAAPAASAPAASLQGSWVEANLAAMGAPSYGLLAAEAARMVLNGKRRYRMWGFPLDVHSVDGGSQSLGRGTVGGLAYVASSSSGGWNSAHSGPGLRDRSHIGVILPGDDPSRTFLRHSPPPDFAVAHLSDSDSSGAEGDGGRGGKAAAACKRGGLEAPSQVVLPRRDDNDRLVGVAGGVEGRLAVSSHHSRQHERDSSEGKDSNGRKTLAPGRPEGVSVCTLPSNSHGGRGPVDSGSRGGHAQLRTDSDSSEDVEGSGGSAMGRERRCAAVAATPPEALPPPAMGDSVRSPAETRRMPPARQDQLMSLKAARLQHSSHPQAPRQTPKDPVAAQGSAAGGAHPVPPTCPMASVPQTRAALRKRRGAEETREPKQTYPVSALWQHNQRQQVAPPGHMMRSGSAGAAEMACGMVNPAGTKGGPAGGGQRRSSPAYPQLDRRTWDSDSSSEEESQRLSISRSRSRCNVPEAMRDSAPASVRSNAAFEATADAEAACRAELSGGGSRPALAPQPSFAGSDNLPIGAHRAATGQCWRSGLYARSHEMGQGAANVGYGASAGNVEPGGRHPSGDGAAPGARGVERQHRQWGHPGPGDGRDSAFEPAGSRGGEKGLGHSRVDGVFIGTSDGVSRGGAAVESTAAAAGETRRQPVEAVDPTHRQMHPPGVAVGGSQSTGTGATRGTRAVDEDGRAQKERRRHHDGTVPAPVCSPLAALRITNQRERGSPLMLAGAALLADSDSDNYEDESDVSPGRSGGKGAQAAHDSADTPALRASTNCVDEAPPTAASPSRTSLRLAVAGRSGADGQSSPLHQAAPRLPDGTAAQGLSPSSRHRRGDETAESQLLQDSSSVNGRQPGRPGPPAAQSAQPATRSAVDTGWTPGASDNASHLDCQPPPDVRTDDTTTSHEDYTRGSSSGSRFGQVVPRAHITPAVAPPFLRAGSGSAIAAPASPSRAITSGQRSAGTALANVQHLLERTLSTAAAPDGPAASLSSITHSSGDVLPVMAAPVIVPAASLPGAGAVPEASQPVHEAFTRQGAGVTLTVAMQGDTAQLLPARPDPAWEAGAMVSDGGATPADSSVPLSPLRTMLAQSTPRSPRSPTPLADLYALPSTPGQRSASLALANISELLDRIGNKGGSPLRSTAQVSRLSSSALDSDKGGLLTPAALSKAGEMKPLLSLFPGMVEDGSSSEDEASVRGHRAAAQSMQRRPVGSVALPGMVPSSLAQQVSSTGTPADEPAPAQPSASTTPPPQPQPGKLRTTKSVRPPPPPPPPPPPTALSSITAAGGSTDAETVGGTPGRKGTGPLPPPPPPPPGKGPLPPPPPGKGKLGGSSPNKERGSPQAPTPPQGLQYDGPRRRKLHWDAIPEHRIRDTIWGSCINTLHATDLDLASLDSLFADNERDKPKKGLRRAADGDPELEALGGAVAPGSKQKKGGRSSVVHMLLDLKRAANVEIMLSNIKMDYSDIVTAILGLEADRLAPETVEQLQRFVPSHEEGEMLRGYVDAGGSPDSLGRAERFFLHLIKIPRLSSKLNALEFRVGFDSCRIWVDKVLDGIHTACTQVLSSGRLRRMLEVVLKLGNTLNEGTRNKSKGFKLASLHRLYDTRSFDGRTTLLHYMVAHIEHTDPIILDVLDELQMAPFAAKFTFSMAENEMTYIKKGVAALSVELSACERTAAAPGSSDEQFASTLRSFHGRADDCLQELRDRFNSTKRHFLRVAAFFGEEVGSDVDGKEPEHFFSTLNGFLSMVESARKDGQRLMVCALPPKESP